MNKKREFPEASGNLCSNCDEFMVYDGVCVNCGFQMYTRISVAAGQDIEIGDWLYLNPKNGKIYRECLDNDFFSLHTRAIKISNTPEQKLIIFEFPTSLTHP